MTCRANEPRWISIDSAFPQHTHWYQWKRIKELWHRKFIDEETEVCKGYFWTEKKWGFVNKVLWVRWSKRQTEDLTHSFTEATLFSGVGGGSGEKRGKQGKNRKGIEGTGWKYSGEWAGNQANLGPTSAGQLTSRLTLVDPCLTSPGLHFVICRMGLKILTLESCCGVKWRDVPIHPVNFFSHFLLSSFKNFKWLYLFSFFIPVLPPPLPFGNY